MSKKDYLFAFNSSLYRPLHVQPFVFNHIKAFHSELAQLQQQHCRNCRELWPTRKYLLPNPSFVTGAKSILISTHSGFKIICAQFFKYSPQHSDLSTQTHNHRRNASFSCYIYMSFYRLPTGGNIAHGYVANFRQDVATYIKEIPLTASQMPYMIIRRREVDDADFKVCQKRVEQVERFFIQNHPGFTHHENTFSHLYTTHFDGSVFFYY